MRCVLCGRRIREASATLPAVEGGSTPHPAGPVGPVCAVKNGLMAPPSSMRVTLFERPRKPRKPRAQPSMAHSGDDRQLDWIEAMR